MEVRANPLVDPEVVNLYLCISLGLFPDVSLTLSLSFPPSSDLSIYL